MTEQEISKKEWKESLVIIGALVVVITIGSILLLPKYWYAWVVLVVVAVVAIIIVVAREETHAVFECPKCAHRFEVPTLKNVFAPHGVVKKEGKWFEWKYLECPMCHEKSKMFRVKEQMPDISALEV